MTRPAYPSGWLLEAAGNCRPRQMIVQDRIRLTGLVMTLSLVKALQRAYARGRAFSSATASRARRMDRSMSVLDMLGGSGFFPAACSGR